MGKKIPSLILLILPILLLSACRQPPRSPLQIQATSVKKDVIIRSVPGDNHITFFIYSPSGIGDLTVELIQGDMPDTVQIRLFVSNLEFLSLSYDDLSITASAPREGPVRETLHMSGGEAQLTPNSYYWMDIQPLPAEEGGKFLGKPAQPPSYLITLPKDFQWGGYTSFSMRWIDYYR